jgi:hypothetical protein
MASMMRSSIRPWSLALAGGLFLVACPEDPQSASGDP